MLSTLSTAWRRSLLGAVAVLAPSVALAQDSGSAEARTVFVPAEPVPPSRGLDVPAPPRVVSAPRAAHVRVPLPIGHSDVLGPSDPPVSDGPQPPGDPCTIDYFVNRAAKPAGALTAIVGEPTAIANGHTSFQTGNWYAALSNDAGMSWTHVNPFTRFPALDAGFCCDQTTVYVPEHDMTLWFLQYEYSATTQRGSIRIAVATSRNGLANDNWSHSFVLSPQLFGQLDGTWFDFPDLAYSDDHLYLSSNIFDANGFPQDSIVAKMALTDVQDGDGSLQVNYWNSKGALGASGSYRFTRGAGNTMYWGSHISTARMRVYRNTGNSQTVNFNDNNVASWNATGYTAIAPNGVNWAANQHSKITGAYSRLGEYGFLWTAASSSGRPHPYVRVAKFSTVSHLLVGENDLWSTTNALMLPAAATNSRSEVGVVLARGDATGSGTLHPTTAVRIVDFTCQPGFGGGSLSQPFTGNASPGFPQWGDYFSVQQHPDYPETFVGTGMTMRGGGGDGYSEPRYLWFGFEPFEPAWVTLTVQDNIPAASSPTIDVSVIDLDGLSDGTTTFSRRFMAQQSYRLTAPLTFDSGGQTYRFCNWRLRSNPSGSFVDQPADQRLLTVASIGTDNDTAEAVYAREAQIEVHSINPDAGIDVAVSVPGLNGAQDGTTPFNRNYKSGTEVTFTAAAAYGANPFKRWRLDGAPLPLGQNALTIRRNTASTLIEAEYYTHVFGDVLAFGQGCLGSNGLAPEHSVLGSSDVQIGTPVGYRVTRVFGATTGALFLGFSTTSWGGVPLPLRLDFIGLDPTCLLLVAADFSLPMSINGLGSGVTTVAIPDDSALIGTHVFTQAIVVDPRVRSPLTIVVSNGLDVRFGGNL
jgi:hypothetical protein